MFYDHEEFRKRELEEIREGLREEVKKEIREEGLEQGTKLAKLDMAKKLLSKNKSLEEIQEFTDLTILEIEELKAS